ncbi:MAG TPA: oligosaccharide flippase family protein [Candidatus Ozemobacteraceae bacterium]|nr:oligosaccharide flippase family protein [Candidatus Ozemobacteraceae bacterium]
MSHQNCPKMECDNPVSTALGKGDLGGLGRRFVNGFSWTMFAVVFSSGFGFLLNIILANYLGKAVYGRLGLVLNTVATLGGMAQLAAETTTTKHVAESRIANVGAAGRILGITSLFTFVNGFLVTVGIACLSAYVAKNLFVDGTLQNLILLASPIVLLTAMDSYQNGALAGLECYSALGKARLFHSVFHLVVCSISCIWAGLPGALIGYVLSYSVRWVVLQWLVVREANRFGIYHDFSGAFREVGVVGGFAIPAAMCGFVAMPALWMTNLFLTRHPDRYAEIGLFAAANALRTLAMYVPIVMNSVSRSLLNSERGSSNIDRYRHLFWANLGLSVMVALATVIGVFFGGASILRIFGRDFVMGSSALQILLISVIPETIDTAAAQVIQSHGKMWAALFVIVIPRYVTLVLVSSYLAPRLGAVGLAWAYTASWTLSMLCTCSLAYYLGLLPSRTSFVKD